MTIFRLASLTAAALLLAGCGNHSGAPQGADAILHVPATGPIAETINGVKVPETLLAAVAKGRGLDLAKPADRERALGELQQYILLAQQAPALQLEQQPDIAAAIEVARLQGVANGVLMAYARSHPISDAQIAKSYQEQTARLGDKTYQVSVLQFTDQATADKVASELRTGTTFDKVFDSYRSRAKVAEALPARFLKQFPPELSSAIAKLSQGQATTQPVHALGGWLLLYVNQIQKFVPPTLAKTHDGIKAVLQQQQADAYIESLKVNAKIESASPARVASLAPGAQPAPLPKGVSGKVVDGAAPAAAATSH